MTTLLYKPSEAAQSLGISRAKVYELIARGDLPSVKLDGSRRVAADDLARFVDRLRAASSNGSDDRGAAQTAA